MIGSIRELLLTIYKHCVKQLYKHSMEKLARWPYLYRHKNGTLYSLRRVPTDVGKMFVTVNFDDY